MGKQLVVAEKPSVASDIAKALGGFSQKSEGDKRWYERDDMVISSGIGHLIEIGVSQEQDTKLLAQLPVIPAPFKLMAIEKTKGQLYLLNKLFKRADITELVNACDAGREGELIFHYIYQALGCRKPFRRLWLQSMTPDSIRDGFKSLRSAQDMGPLCEAAVCRSEADWLLGINPTRALTALHTGASGGVFDLQTTGRVQGPTLAMVVDREEAIRTFVPKDYWEVQATFAAAAGSYGGVWFDPKFVKGENEDARPERLWDAARAQAIAEKCRGETATSVKEEATPDKVSPPLLFDLTTLQREANAKFGFTAADTLKIAQALYEKHKVLSYPRTDAKALPEDYPDTARAVLQVLKSSVAGKFAAEALDGNYVKPNKRIFDNSKISDHFAIIPTVAAASGLSDAEQKIYDLVVKRFVAAFFPSAEFLKTTRITTVADEQFKSTGSVMKVAGWKAVYGREDGDKDAAMCSVSPGELPMAREASAVGKQTKAPDRYTEATLLAAMEHAGRLVDDESLREAMSAKGLGTPATRAATIEGLVQKIPDKKLPYIVREGKELVPTEKAFRQVAFLRTNGVAALTSPELTGEWEHRLKLMEQGKYRRADFMADIVEQTKRIIDGIRGGAPAMAPQDLKTLSGPCPKCGGAVAVHPSAYACACGFRLGRVLLDRKITESEMESLLRDGRTATLDGFVSKMKKKFSAQLKVSDAKDKVEFDFADRAAGGSASAAAVPAEPVGKCPKCGGGVVARAGHYFCEKNTREKPQCDFMLSGVFAKKPINAETAGMLLREGRTPLLNGFVSGRTGNKFSAYLVRKPDHSIGFEFES